MEFFVDNNYTISKNALKDYTDFRYVLLLQSLTLHGMKNALVRWL